MIVDRHGRPLQGQTRKYDAASYSRRTAGWRRVTGSANAETNGQAPILRDRSRDLVQNNSWAVKALGIIVSNTVGTGIVAQPKGAKVKVKRASTLWKSWATSPAQCDFEGVNDFAGLQALAVATAVRDGMALVRRRRVGGRAVPMQLQVLEPDFLDTAKFQGNGNSRVIQGVQVDPEGRVEGYWLFPYHPGDTGWLGTPAISGLTSQFVPASEVLPVFRKDRAGQLIGVTWFAPVMVPLRDLDAYEDAELVKQKTAACYVGFVTKEADPDDDDDSDIEAFEPGAIEHLAPGEQITFANPPKVDGFSEFTRACLRKVAAGLGITYEALTGDYSQVNFSSGRMGWIEMGRNIERWQWQMLIPQLCAPVWDWFVEAARVAGNDLAGVTATWTPPRRELIDPHKEYAATKAAIRAGLISLPEAQRELGYDPDELLDEIAASNAALDKREIVLDSDPRRTTNAGLGAVWGSGLGDVAPAGDYDTKEDAATAA